MTLLYQHTGVALLRSTALSLAHAPDAWPDPDDVAACRAWLRRMWPLPGLAEAIGQASPSLAARLDGLLAGDNVRDRQVLRAAAALTRYLLRATGRPTPFGLFAGVAPVALGAHARVRWGDDHRPVVRVGAEWLADIISRLEACPELLERLDVVLSDLAVRRGNRLELPHGPNRVTIRHTSAVHAAYETAAAPVRFCDLADKLTGVFPDAGSAKVRGLLTELVRRGFLMTSLRAPFTVTDPLAHLIDRLVEAGADMVEPVVPLLRELQTVRVDVAHHNRADTIPNDLSRGMLTRRMRALSEAGRTPLAADLLLDCDVQIPHSVVEEMERAASALLRLGHQRTGQEVWREYHAAFLDRYGIGALVPLRDAIAPDAGLGYPAGYPGSLLPEPRAGTSDRDERLLALAWRAIADGSHEIALTEGSIQALTRNEPLDERRIPPHVELSARIYATSTEALEHGEYTLTIAPARSAGTLTSRFTPTATGSGLEEVYRTVPTATAGALPVQLSFPPRLRTRRERLPRPCIPTTPPAARRTPLRAARRRAGAHHGGRPRRTGDP
ncbi:lantibiotic dehydratase family protein [Streptomyces sp. ME19-01-6]|uniref:lantibiotic dehydratase family protein n=1 Tax=Streptomyces sp. ME19-01-6 TaxID=3028686 RepID=UPI0029A8C45D|nr:lantibiotic dehydratase family protein [Streptomyces sp. ME19-01-6]MDX3224726.1 lantibiotic dehydratase family protein [Streptomyces sp. ME19-01-6]